MSTTQEEHQEQDELHEEARRGPWLVSLYRVSRRYGGPEEGGWWYDWLELDDNEPSRGPYLAWGLATRMRDGLQAQEPPLRRFSAGGGSDTQWELERERGAHASTVRPHYE